MTYALAAVSLLAAWLAWRYYGVARRAAQADSLSKLNKGLVKNVANLAKIADEKEKKIRELEEYIVEHFGDDELVGELNRVFSGTGRSGGGSTPGN